MDADNLIAGKFLLRSRLGVGSFGEVFEGLNVQSGQAVAVKIERRPIKAPQLIHEGKVLRSMEGKEGVPAVLWYGSETDRNIMVMTLLGRSLSSLIQDYGTDSLPLKLVLQAGSQMLSRLETVHASNWLHRDVKPDNFVLGRPPHHSLVFIIDFGLAKKYRDDRTHQHIFYREDKRLTGTARYASLNCHLGLELSRRDDLESWVYSLLYLIKGSLPWQGRAKQRNYDNITQLKTSLSIQEVCRGAPVEFGQMLAYCRAMKFEETPDYKFLAGQLVDIATKNKVSVSEPLELMTAVPAMPRRSSTQVRKKHPKVKAKTVARKSMLVISSVAQISSTLALNATEDSDQTAERHSYQWPTISQVTRDRLHAVARSQTQGCNLPF